MIDLFLLAILGLITWCVASEGAWSSVLTFLSTMFAGILAMNFFEPLAVLLMQNVPLGSGWTNRWDFIAFMLIFIGAIFAFRIATEQILPTFIDVHPLAHDSVRWIVGAMTGYLTMAIVLTSLHTTPLPRNFLGFEPERKNFLGISAPDRQWLGFVQYMTEKGLGREHAFDGSTVTLSNGQTVTAPSFVIRYATRRGTGVGGGGTSASTNNQPPPVIIAPTGGGGGAPRF